MDLHNLPTPLYDRKSVHLSNAEALGSCNICSTVRARAESVPAHKEDPLYAWPPTRARRHDGRRQDGWQTVTLKTAFE